MQTIKDVLPGIFNKLQSPIHQQRQRLLASWGEIVGEKMVPHTKPSLDEKGRLFVWVDQSSLAFELNQRYRLGLLKRVQALLGEEEVKTIFIRVGQIRA